MLASLAQLGLIYVYMLIVILLVGLGYVGFRLVNWAITSIVTPSTKQIQKATAGKQDVNQGWMRLAFLSATILFLAIYTSGMFKVIGGGESSHDHQAHAQNSSQTATSNQSSTMPSYQSQSSQPNQYQFNQYQFQNQLNIISYQLSQMESQLNEMSN